MIYVDSSVVLAQVFNEDRIPPVRFWRNQLVSSTLTQYEMWTRLHRMQRSISHREEVLRLLERIELVDMLPDVLERALTPFPVPLRTLDAIHLATASFLRASDATLELASYDRRLNGAARAIEIPLANC